MKFAKTIRKVIAHDAEGINVRGEINAVVAANVDARKGTVVATTDPETHERPSAQTKPRQGEADV